MFIVVRGILEFIIRVSLETKISDCFLADQRLRKREYHLARPLLLRSQGVSFIAFGQCLDMEFAETVFHLPFLETHIHNVSH